MINKENDALKCFIFFFCFSFLLLLFNTAEPPPPGVHEILM